jgi:hypothetical protein
MVRRIYAMGFDYGVYSSWVMMMESINRDFEKWVLRYLIFYIRHSPKGL